MTEPRSALVPDGPALPAVTAGILVFDGVTLLDVVGPHTVFALAGMHVQLISETLAPISTDTNIRLPPEKAGAELTNLFTTVTKPVFQSMADAATHLLAQNPAQ